MATKVTNGLDLLNQRIVNVGNPSSDQDVATKAYVDAVARGLDWKDAVVAASTGNVTVATAPASIDGVTLAAGSRVLLKDQTTGSENGIYTYSATGSPLVRALDADSSAEVTAGMAVTVTGGTANADRLYVLTTDTAVTLGTTALTFVQVGAGGATYTAGNGLTLTGVDFNIGAGTGISVAADSVSIDTAIVPRKFSANVGNGSLTAIPITHNLANRDVHVEVYTNATPWDTVICDVERTDTNTVTLRFATAPASNAYRVVVIG